MLPTRKRPRTADDASAALAGVQALVGLAQLQLLVQTLDSDNADGRSTGLLGFIGALERRLALAVVSVVITIAYSAAAFA